MSMRRATPALLSEGPQDGLRVGEEFGGRTGGRPDG